MPKHRALVPAAIILGVFFIIIAIIYWVEPAKSLPFPDFLGHQSGDDTHHYKHGIASFLVGIACFVFAWFQAGPKKTAAAVEQPPTQP